MSVIGGKFLGQGTYGCVFSPPLLCKDDETRSIGVGKVFGTSEDFIDEETELKAISKIDPKGKYTTLPSKSCVVPEYNITKEDQFVKCKHNTNYAPKYNQIIFKDQGVDLSKHCLKSYKFSNLLDGFINLAKGLIEFEKEQTCHRDIKRPNIIIQKNESMKYIDFGLSCKYNDIFTQKSENILIYPYPYFPPEFFVYGCYLNHKNPIFDNTFKKKHYAFLKYKFDKIGFDDKTQDDQLAQVIETHNEQSKSNMYKFYTKTCAHKVDVFSLGVVMTEVYCSNNANLDDLNDIQKSAIESLLRNSLNFNAQLRFTPSELVVALKKINNIKDTPEKSTKISPQSPQMSKTKSSKPQTSKKESSKQQKSKEQGKKKFVLNVYPQIMCT